MVDPNMPPAASDTSGWIFLLTLITALHGLELEGISVKLPWLQTFFSYTCETANTFKHTCMHGCTSLEAHHCMHMCVYIFSMQRLPTHINLFWFKCQKQQQWKKVGWGTSRLIYPWIRSGQISPIINKWLTFPCYEVYKPQGSSRTQQGLDSIPAVYQCEQKQPLATNTWGDKPRMANRVKPIAPPTLIYNLNLKMLSLIFRLNQPFCYHNIIHTAILLATFFAVTFSFCPNNSPVIGTHPATTDDFLCIQRK